MLTRRLIAVTLVVVSLDIVASTAARAHLPSGITIEAFQFPDGLTPVVDGDLADWGLAGPGLTLADFTDLVAGSPADALDLDAEVWVGWNDSDNRLYVAARVRDDIHQVDRPAGSAARIFQDDDLEIFLDPDHSGGQYADFSDLSLQEQFAANGSTASHFVLAGPHPDGISLVNFSAASWYALEQGAHSEAAVRFVGEPGGAGTVTYEFSATPFDLVNVTADFLSRSHDLRDGEVIGFNLEFSDYDTRSEVFDAKWSLSGGQNAFRLSERFTDLRLAALEDRFQPTAVTPNSWARIKASFAPR
ncbi:MAG: hypothetical protein HOM68_28710 [Gemmatimonadetes bacterium]|nr:hypothetical protein [Gemmatimonadota bacterium]MBT5141813.1 hypothetical protein [Gemmatimonadota bacterium]MBT5588683.1 hypothetical protein [Gemmatimonadota bacterium]MBT5962551.1 hypothetical protein [Gemmatimonadota bacterium]MBT6628498.1 hypothetical protein [Gemmatimonadota bacterium]